MAQNRVGNNGGKLGFEAELFKAADKLRGNTEPSDYKHVALVLVQMLEPYQGRVYDPCCGSGGMFVQSEKFVLEHSGRIGDIAIYGQESNYTTWRLAKMNLAVRGIDSDIRWNNEGSLKNERRVNYLDRRRNPKLLTWAREGTHE